MKICKKRGHEYSDGAKQCPECVKIRANDSGVRQAARDRAAEQRRADPEKAKADLAAWRARNRAQMTKTANAWKKANPEKVVVSRKKFYIAHKDQVDRENVEWAKNNKQKSNRVKAGWVEKNRDKVVATLRAYYAANKEKFLHNGRIRRARVAGADGVMSEGVVEKLFVFQDGLCACCGELLGDKFDLDHIVPISKGGSNGDENLQLLRSRCNKQKNARNPIEFMRLHRQEYIKTWANNLYEWRKSL
jgi:5-methylcytosine-specific restriction endonuclease McrA